MDAHERAEVQKRLAEVDAAIVELPKHSPRAALVEQWKTLLEEKEQLEERLADTQSLEPSQQPG